ncbi:MAG: hypothetical protein V2A66_09450 [Pseudomonadota bacterium]
MNSLDCSKLGKLNFEVRDRDIRNSRIVVMDCHWYFPLGEIGRMAAQFKKINPVLKIIVGGHTATIFAEPIVEHYDIDYVIKGDAEYPFSMLVDRLLDGLDTRDVPNVISRGRSAPQSYAVSGDAYSASDCITIDWFPTYKERMKKVHSSIPFGSPLNEILGTYPFITAYKGCRYDCEFCYARRGTLRKIYKRGLVARSPESVVRDLRRLSRDECVKRVYVISDFASMLGREYVDKICSRRYDLDLYYEFEYFNLPPVDTLQKIVESFNMCYFIFPFAEPFHRDIEKRYGYLKAVLSHFAKTHSKCKIVIYRGKLKKFEKYYDGLKKIYEGLEFRSCAQWFIPVPLPDMYKKKAKMDEYFNIWRTKADRDMKVLCRGLIAKTIRQMDMPNRW